MSKQTFTHQVLQGTPRRAPARAYAADGAIVEVEGFVFITGGSAVALTLADPPADKDGLRLCIRATTTFAHTVDNSAGSGFDGGGASSDVATFNAAGDTLEVVSLGGVWYVVNNISVTLA